jgi:uncharacterized membrane protein YdjX (TVP38/TMEM64 family)
LKKTQATASFLTLLLLGSLVVLYFVSPTVQQTLNEGFRLAKAGDEAALAEWFEQFGIWGPIAIILFMVLQMFLIIFPSWLPMVVATIGYGPVWGVVISIVAVIVASGIGYWIGRVFGAQARERFISQEKEEEISEALEKYGFGTVVLFRLSPFLSTDAISIIAGLLGMRFVPYLLATLAGITPLALGIAYFTRDLDQLKTGLYWLGGIGILLYGLYIWLDRKRKKS